MSRGRIRYGMNVSLDGFVADAAGGLDWGRVDDELHQWFNDRARTLAGSLYGRRLYEVMAAYWPTGEANPESTDVMREFARIWNATPRFVFSTMLEHVDHNSRLVRGDVGEVLSEVRRELDGDLEVGGPDLAGQFLRHGLVDEIELVVHPVVLGSGLRFWPTLDAPLAFELREVHRFSSGAVALTYVRR
jgi:dihydrofolate reductase